MFKSKPSSLDEFFNPRDIYRGHCIQAWLWSVAAVLLLQPFVLVCGLFLSLLVERGNLSVGLPADQVPAFAEMTGIEVPLDRPKEGEPISEQATPLLVPVHFEERGILPDVWRTRNVWWGPMLASIFRSSDWLKSNVHAAVLLLITGLLILWVREFCLSRQRLACQRAALDAVSIPRRNLHRQVLRLGPEDLDGSECELASSLFTTDVDNMRRGLAEWIERVTRYPLELVALVSVIFGLQPFLALQTTLLVAAIWYILEQSHATAFGRLRLAKDRADSELRQLVDGFRTARLVRGLGIEQAEHEKFASQLMRHRDLVQSEIMASEAEQHPRLFVFVLATGFAAFMALLLTANVLMRDRGMSAAAAGVFVAVWVVAIPAIHRWRRGYAHKHSAIVSADSIHRYLSQLPTVGQAVGAKFLQPLSRTMHFESVTYRRPNGPLLLDGLDLQLEAGKVYAIVSANPLESKTLVSLLPRFIEPQQGRILFDGEDIAWATLESLRAETVFVGADDPTLAGTVLDNIRGGNTNATLQQVTEAAKLTHAHSFIVKLFNGYETVLTGRDDILNAGQRFQLNLARAILRNPTLLIIEEPQETLNDDSKAFLADAYDRICPGRTVIFIPARMSTVRRCDSIVVLHDGKVAAMGPQSRLVNLSPIYRHWEYLNFNEFRQPAS